MMLLTAIFIIGLSGIVAQIFILRELLVNLYGNELNVGIIFANWVASEALGVFIIGRLADKAKNKLRLFLTLNTLFALFLPAGIYLARVFKGIIGIAFIEAVALPVAIISSFIIILPIAFLHGALFSCGCKIYSPKSDNLGYSIGKFYALEALGALCGGFALAYILIPRLNSFQAVLGISLLNIILTLVLIPGRRFKYITAAGVITLSLFIFNPLSAYLQRRSIEKQWVGMQVLDYRNSNYGNIAVTLRLGEYTFFYNGLPIISLPSPDKQFVAELGNLPLLFHPNPKRVLVAGSGAGGLIAEALKHPLEALDYVEIDPLVIELLKKYPTSLSAGEFSDSRARIINTDPRLFLKTKENSYDIILLGFSNQADLASNRFFTAEFFALAKLRLNPGGIISLWLPGSLAYLDQELTDLNSCILNSLSQAYKYVRVIPGDYNIILASDAEALIKANPELLSQRIIKRNLSPGIFIPEYLKYRLDRGREDEFNRQLLSSAPRLNLDLHPAAVFQSLKITNKKFSPQLSRVFDYLSSQNLKFICFVLFLAFTGLILFSRARHALKLSVTYSIFTTGFFGMATSLLLIFTYQVYYGYLYQKISLLTAVFMAGLAAGSIFMASRLSRIKDAKFMLILLEALLLIFSLALGFSIAGLNLVWERLAPVLHILLFSCGLFMGLEFPLAAKTYASVNGDDIGRVSGALYASDLAGGWLAGIFTGVVFLPVLGFLNTCLLIGMLKLSSLLLLLKSPYRDTQ